MLSGVEHEKSFITPDPDLCDSIFIKNVSISEKDLKKSKYIKMFISFYFQWGYQHQKKT